MSNIEKYGHWVIEDVGHFEPSDWFGFVYLVTNTATGNKYIGKKQFFSVTRKKIEGRKNKKIIKKPSKWESYCTSSTYVKDAIKEYGKHNFEFRILHLCKTTGESRYTESNLLHVSEALTKKFDVSGERVYYNAQIDAIRHIPKEPVPDKVKRILND